MLGTFDIGTLVTLTGTFTNASGTLTDPSSVTCAVRGPDGSTPTVSPSRVSTGIWSGTLDLTGVAPGVWRFRFVGTGAVQAAEEDTFYVEPSYVLTQEP